MGVDCRYYRSLQVLSVISCLLVFTSSSHLSARRGASSSNSHDNIEIHKRVGNTAQPPGLVSDFHFLLGSEPGFVGVNVNRHSVLNALSGRTVQVLSGVAMVQ